MKDKLNFVFPTIIALTAGVLLFTFYGQNAKISLPFPNPLPGVSPTPTPDTTLLQNRVCEDPSKAYIYYCETDKDCERTAYGCGGRTEVVNFSYINDPCIKSVITTCEFVSEPSYLTRCLRGVCVKEDVSQAIPLTP